MITTTIYPDGSILTVNEKSEVLFMRDISGNISIDLNPEATYATGIYMETNPPIEKLEINTNLLELVNDKVKYETKKLEQELLYLVYPNVVDIDKIKEIVNKIERVKVDLYKKYNISEYYEPIRGREQIS